MESSTPGTPVDEVTQIIGWRQHELEEAGYDGNQASIIANHLDVDLHTACDLLEAGCPPDQAVLILT
jgi:hypothetical protein